MTHADAIELLKRLIQTPSVSKNEKKSAELLTQEMHSRGCSPQRFGNNILAYNHYFDPQKTTVILCSHHDTVPPNGGYTIDPYTPTVKDGKLYGLGSNDAGASVVSLFAAFDNFFKHKTLKYNLALLLTAQEECSGSEGMEMVYPKLHNPELVVVGEPTGMDVAVAERGLVVLDCVVEGVAGHTANENTINPITLALEDLKWFSEYKFPKTNEMLGSVKMSVNVIEAGSVHNIVPKECKFIVDVRSNGCYTNQEIVSEIQKHVNCTVTPRSLRLNPSSIPTSHPFVQSCIVNGAKTFGSSTMSDQALVKCPSVKIGVGDTLRSHTADEWIYLKEIEQGIQKYIKILNHYLL